jgi:hypothetical protein
MPFWGRAKELGTVKFLTALSSILFFPSVFYWLNPFAVSIASDIYSFRPTSALIKAYVMGLVRDILLVSPRFGLLGLSSALACIGANKIVRYFSIEGMLGVPIVFCFVCLEAFLDAGLCFVFVPSDSEVSPQQVLMYVVYSCLYASAYLSLTGLYKGFFKRREIA